MNEYVKYQHVEKIGTVGCDGVLDGLVYVFPKLDGTNANVWREEGGICFGSRKRKISTESDNAGFAKWCSQSVSLNKLMGSLPLGIHVFGEWLVPHTLKTYEESAWRRFYVFDIFDPETGMHVPYPELEKICEDAGYKDYIKPINILRNPTKDDIIECAKGNTWMITDGIGEGVVCKNYSYKNKFGRQTWGKYVVSDFKQTKTACRAEDPCRVEVLIVDSFLTKDIVDKVIARIDDDLEKKRRVPFILGSVYHDFLEECIYDAINKFKNPTIEFRKLRQCVNNKVKTLVPEEF